MMHPEVTLYLRHRIEVDSDHDEQGSTSHQVSYLDGEIEKVLHERRNDRDEGKEESTRQDDPSENPVQIFFELVNSTTGRGKKKGQ